VGVQENDGSRCANISWKEFFHRSNPRAYAQKFFIVIITWKSRLLTTFFIKSKPICTNKERSNKSIFVLKDYTFPPIWFFPLLFDYHSPPSPRYSFSFQNNEGTKGQLVHYGLTLQFKCFAFSFKKKTPSRSPRVKCETPYGINFAFSFFNLFTMYKTSIMLLTPPWLILLFPHCQNFFSLLTHSQNKRLKFCFCCSFLRQ